MGKKGKREEDVQWTVEGEETGSAPDHRVTRVISRTMEALRNDPEYSDDLRVVCLIMDGTAGVKASCGHDSIDQVIADIVVHLDAYMHMTGAGCVRVTRSEDLN